MALIHFEEDEKEYKEKIKFRDPYEWFVDKQVYKIKCEPSSIEPAPPAPDISDFDARIKLLKMFGLPPVIKPDKEGLKKLNGLLADAVTKRKTFDAVSFVKSMREGM